MRSIVEIVLPLSEARRAYELSQRGLACRLAFKWLSRYWHELTERVFSFALIRCWAYISNSGLETRALCPRTCGIRPSL
ncbi:MAG: hypothetical protein ACREYE_00260 [Gammaproteobacteria bacterium]